MSESGTVRWSWAALLASSVAASTLLITSTFAIDPFRSDVDKDVSSQVLSSPWEVLATIALFAWIAAFFIVAGWWAGKLSSRRWVFFAVVASLPPLQLAWEKVAGIVARQTNSLNGRGASLDPGVFYLPNYLDVLAILFAFGAASLIFARVAERKKISASDSK